MSRIGSAKPTQMNIPENSVDENKPETLPVENSESVKEIELGIVPQKMIEYETLSARAEFGKKALAILSGGNVIDDELFCGIITESIERIESGAGWIILHFPKNIEQYRYFILSGYFSTCNFKDQN